MGARVLDLSAVAFALFYGDTGILAAFDEDPMLEVAAWLGVGVLTLVYAGAPRRLPFAYLGSLLVTAGTGRLLDDRGVGVIEAYTAPLVLLLAVIGVVQASRDRRAPTMLTMGPALSVALLPSLAATLEGGSALRLAGVTVVAILALGVGLLRGLAGPGDGGRPGAGGRRDQPGRALHGLRARLGDPGRRWRGAPDRGRAVGAGAAGGTSIPRPGTAPCAEHLSWVVGRDDPPDEGAVPGRDKTAF